MLDFINEPSAAISKRLYQIGYTDYYNISLNQDILNTYNVMKCVKHLQNSKKSDLLFHGFNSVESYLKMLFEYGLDIHETTFTKLVDILLETPPDDSFYERGISKVGRVLEDKGHSGSNTIRAASLVCADKSIQNLVKQEINHSLNCFLEVVKYESIHDFAFLKNGKWIFKKNMLFPGFYNLRVLAFSDIWKNTSTMMMLEKALCNLIKLQPLPYIYIHEKGQMIAPASYLMHNFDISFHDCSDDEKAEWLLRTEYIARIGMMKVFNISKSSLYSKDTLLDDINNIRKSYSFMKWGSYTGICLEENWRKAQRKLNDIAFRFELIRYWDNKSAFA